MRFKQKLLKNKNSYGDFWGENTSYEILKNLRGVFKTKFAKGKIELVLGSEEKAKLKKMKTFLKLRATKWGVTR